MRAWDCERRSKIDLDELGRCGHDETDFISWEPRLDQRIMLDPGDDPSRCFTPGHSAATIEKRAESRAMKSVAIRWARRIPSNFPPIRSSAARERSLRTSV